uniref:Uncharacterized protein n=1 Tax=Candidatus Kentrum sp. LFY TaxID=2126342 RepID=A0A450UFM7_9GAMM|nr:MAG: hypothetical protein BECKLFY1418A_GA0070994_101532 [Candidatus Kentron sp. LFY]
MTPRNGRTHSRPYREIDADSVSFVQNALTAALHPQDHRPPSPPASSTKEFKNDVDPFTALTGLGIIAASVASRVDDTRLAVGRRGHARCCVRQCPSIMIMG